jgi:hypothetical protein
MADSVAATDYPAVPLAGNGTAGQINPATMPTGTACRTSIGTARLKALEKLATLRDRQRDKGRDNVTDGAATLPHRTDARHGGDGTVSAPAPNAGRTNPSAFLDLAELPAGPCPACGGSLWWRLSVLSGGPGPWCCGRCIPPDPVDWLDGHAVPVGPSKPIAVGKAAW